MSWREAKTFSHGSKSVSWNGQQCLLPARHFLFAKQLYKTHCIDIAWHWYGCVSESEMISYCWVFYCWMKWGDTIQYFSIMYNECQVWTGIFMCCGAELWIFFVPLIEIVKIFSMILWLTLNSYFCLTPVDILVSGHSINRS